jgi:hypothetical protein
MKRPLFAAGIIQSGGENMRVNGNAPVVGILPLRVLAALAILMAAMLALPGYASAMKVISDKTATGFVFPESVAYDPAENVLYASEFGGTELKPGEKDGKGYIVKVSLEGKIIDDHFLPAPGVIMNKPKGLWVVGHSLWVTDIDGVWQFDTTTKKGKKLMLPGAEFANDPAIVGKVLYVSDNRADQLFAVEPADFLNLAGEPKITVAWKGKGINPNGVYPGQGGTLLMVGFKSDKEPKGIYSMKPGEDPKALSKDIGRLDGLYQLKNGNLIVTDWNTGSVFEWSEKGGMTPLAQGFKGPADLCVYPTKSGMMLVVPDLVQSQLRFIELGN